MKRKYIISLILGIFFIMMGVTGMFFVYRERQNFLFWVLFAVMIIGGFMMRHAIFDLMRMARFNREKQETLNRLEALRNQGGISDEDYHAQKIQILGMEYDS